jgi:hypothetical protein
MFLLIATVLYGLGFAGAFFSHRRPFVAWTFLVPALTANAVAVAARYHQAWPMLPMYLNTAAVPVFLGVFLFFVGRNTPQTIMLRKIILTLALIIAAATVLFPKDFYLPFIKSHAPAAHFFFWFTVAGKACFLVSAAWALTGLLTHTNQPSKTSREKHDTTETPLPSPPITDDRQPIPDHRLLNTDHRAKNWTIYGFTLWTLGMFSGELWSYLGWGTPVVWDDPAITTTMATWFFYICLLHLHLTGSWTARGRCLYAAAGAVVVLALNCTPDLGPFRGIF